MQLSDEDHQEEPNLLKRRSMLKDMASQQDLVHHLVEHFFRAFFCTRISGGSIQSSSMITTLPQQQQHTAIYTLGHGPLSSSWTSLSESANSLTHLRPQEA